MDKKPGPVSYRNSGVEIKSKRQLFHPFSPLLDVIKLEEYKPVMLGKRRRPVSRVYSVNYTNYSFEPLACSTPKRRRRVLLDSSRIDYDSIETVRQEEEDNKFSGMSELPTFELNSSV